MRLQGKLYAESPIYRGNARKTLFTRDGDGKQRLVSLAGEIEGTAQSLMDAFIGQSRNRRNVGLLNRLWQRLYQQQMPPNLITRVTCRLSKSSYPGDNFFDLRMGIKLNEDRWSVEANANYKMETVLRNSTFDFEIDINESVVQQGDNRTRLFYVLEELRAGRFWFGAGKTKGLGRCRLDLDLPFSPGSPVKINPRTNHLRIDLHFNAENPLLVGWNWGKVDPHTPAYAAIDGRALLGGMRSIPASIRNRLEMALGGPIATPQAWKSKLGSFLTRILAIWLQESAKQSRSGWVLPESAINKLGKGKHALAQRALDGIASLAGQVFASKSEAEEAISAALGKKANMAPRVVELLEQQQQEVHEFDQQAWQQTAEALGLDPTLAPHLASRIADEASLVAVLQPEVQKILPALNQQVDQQLRLLQSDTWVDAEIASREAHLAIKKRIQSGQISESQWNDPSQPPAGIKAADWQEFLGAHQRVAFAHMRNPRNLEKSITNDQNFIDFLKAYRVKARQELGQPHHIDFRAGGSGNREYAKKYGKPYDNIFMRMLSWTPSSSQEGRWEAYVPGSTIKGAFRWRTSQVLRTCWGDSERTRRVLNRLFGAQGQEGLLRFGDTYLKDPNAPAENWCSMDGVRMDPQTAEPIEEAKADYLFAYGTNLHFTCAIDIQDMEEDDLECYSVLLHLLQDFQRGDIPLGGEKTKGFGWVEGQIETMQWLGSPDSKLRQKLFGGAATEQAGAWETISFDEKTAAKLIQDAPPLESKAAPATPPTAAQGFISHRAFGGHCGMLLVEGKVLTPLSVQESGQPNVTTMLNGEPINGWDCYSISSPEAARRPAEPRYALPSKSLRGMLRHIYTIASDAKEESPNLSALNPADGLFGWIGSGPNQSLASRLSIHFGLFDNPQLAWFKIPYPYGSWKFLDGRWQKLEKGRTDKHHIDGRWRLFPHAPLAPIVEQLNAFEPDTVQASYFRAILPGATCRFTLRFWNLTDEELQRLLWCIDLEPNLAHKIGRGRYVGMGSLRLRTLPESYLIDWQKRYAGDDKAWQKPLDSAAWHKKAAVHHRDELRRLLDADSI